MSNTVNINIMKKQYLLLKSLGLIAVSALLSMEVIAQSRIIEIEPLLGSVNDIIDGDTTDTGERIDPEDTVYQLQGGQLYPLTRSIENDGYPLYIRTNPNDSERAILQPFAGSGGEASRAFQARGDLRIEGIQVKNVDQLGGLQERTIRMREDDIRLTIDNCWLEIDDQVTIRCDENGARIFISNSIISNQGQGNDPDNGRLIDDRGNDVDSLVIFNTVAYNITSRFLRDGGGLIDYAEVNQNTFVNSSQRGFDFGEIGELIFTNNMIANGSFEGVDVPEGDNGFEEGFVTIAEWSNDPGAQQLTVTNNNIFTESSLTDLYPAGVVEVPLLDSLGTALLGSAAQDNTTEVVTFTNGPAAPVAYLTDFFNDNVPNSATWWDDDSNFPDFPEYDFSYANSFASFSGGTDGQPIGTLQDFNLSTAERNTIDFGLYPNPAKDQLFVDIPQDADVRVIRVFNIVGSEVSAYPANVSGLHSLDLSDFNSGLYIITLVDGAGNISSKKLVIR
jgi:hypothetical protein